MNWTVFVTTFVTMFLAEMGDKTQIAAFSFAAEEKSKWTVFIAASLALVAVTAIGVLAGGIVGKYVSPSTVKYVSGFLFIGIGVWILLNHR